MKKIFRNIVGAVMSGLAIVACSPEDFSGANEMGLPSIDNYEAKVTVDQESNVATFEIVCTDGSVAEGVYPIWTINTGSETKSTVNGFKTNKVVVAGTYSYTFQVGNRNGISDGVKSGTFTINTTRYDFLPTIEKLTGGSSKEWRVYSATKGHLGCGEGHNNPAGWWSAGPEEKASEGMYDDRVIFTKTDAASAGAYSYSAGEDGNTFLNAGVTLFPGNPGADWSYPCVGLNGAQTDAAFTLDYNADRDEVGIVLPAKTLFPYLANDVQFNQSATYWITDLTDKVMTLVLDLDGISWQVILINGENEAQEEGFDPDKVNWCGVNDAENLAIPFNTAGSFTFWWATWGWANGGDGSQNPIFSYDNGVYSITTVSGGEAAWQGQCSIPDVAINIEEGQTYDISFKVDASESYENLIFKVCETDNDDNILINKEGIKLKKGENVVRYAKVFAEKTVENEGSKEVVLGSFTSGKLIFDVGNRPEGLTLKFSDFIIQKHNPK